MKMNTKYFCRPYLVGDAEIPENVKPKVLMYLQKAYSTKTGKDLGVNKKDKKSWLEEIHNPIKKCAETTV